MPAGREQEHSAPCRNSEPGGWGCCGQDAGRSHVPHAPPQPLSPLPAKAGTLQNISTQRCPRAPLPCLAQPRVAVTRGRGASLDTVSEPGPNPNRCPAPLGTRHLIRPWQCRAPAGEAVVSAGPEGAGRAPAGNGDVLWLGTGPPRPPAQHHPARWRGGAGAPHCHAAPTPRCSAQPRSPVGDGEPPCCQVWGSLGSQILFFWGSWG